MRRNLALSFLTAALALVGVRANADTCPHGTGFLNIAGSTAAGEIISGGVGALMADAGTTIVYWGGGSCTGLDSFYSSTAGVGTAKIYNADGTVTSCGLDGGVVADMVASDVYPTTCQNAGAFALTTDIPPGYSDVHGPWQAMLFVQPASASGVSGISAEQAYWVLGFGPNGGDVSPWNQLNQNNSVAMMPPYFTYIRNNGSGTQDMITAFVYQGYEGYAANWQGYNAGSSGNVVSGVGGTPATGSPDSVIGIVALDAYGQNRALAAPTLNDLAFRAYGQSTAWYPDSSHTANDRQNVRNGLYQMTGPLHFVTACTGTPCTTITLPEAAAFLNILNGTTQLTGTDIVAVAAQQFVTPDCAMQVTRAQDGPPLTSYSPPHLCGCAFEHDVVATSSIVPYACVSCGCPTGTTCSATCPAAQPICNYGYCEAQ